MGPEKVENIDTLTFKQAKNHKFASRKLISQYGFGHKMGQEAHSKLQLGYFCRFFARIRMGPDKVENIDELTFKKGQKKKYASRSLF